MAKDEQTAKQDFDALIQRMIEEKTFSFEAVEALKALREEVVDLKEKNKALSEENFGMSLDMDNLKDSLRIVRAELEEADKELADWRSREKRLIDRENTIVLIEKDQWCAERIAQNTMEILHAAFKNPTFRQTVISKAEGRNTAHGWTDAKHEEVTTEQIAE